MSHLSHWCLEDVVISCPPGAQGKRWSELLPHPAGQTAAFQNCQHRHEVQAQKNPTYTAGLEMRPRTLAGQGGEQM